MTDLVSAAAIEKIVGIKRHPTEHYGRALPIEGMIYILHSQECLDTVPDLRQCEFSIALDRGLMHSYCRSAWHHLEGQTVHLKVSLVGCLLPEEIKTDD